MINYNQLNWQLLSLKAKVEGTQYMQVPIGYTEEQFLERAAQQGFNVVSRYNQYELSSKRNSN